LFLGISASLILIAYVIFLFNVCIKKHRHIQLKLQQFFEATFQAPLIGATIGQLAVLLPVGFITIMKYFPLESYVTQFYQIGSEQTDDEITANEYGRIGGSFLISSIILMTIGVGSMITGPRQKEESRLKNQLKVRYE